MYTSFLLKWAHHRETLMIFHWITNFSPSPSKYSDWSFTGSGSNTSSGQVSRYIDVEDFVAVKVNFEWVVDVILLTQVGEGDTGWEVKANSSSVLSRHYSNLKQLVFNKIV